MIPTLILVLLYCFSLAHAVDPTVSLTYGKYKGTALSNDLTQWLIMRYAAAPVGALRFAALENPPRLDSIGIANSVCRR